MATLPSVQPRAPRRHRLALSCIAIGVTALGLAGFVRHVHDHVLCRGFGPPIAALVPPADRSGIETLPFHSRALGPRPERAWRTALLRTGVVLARALALQALSLQIVLLASFGFDWPKALDPAAPFACAFGALSGIAADNWLRSSSDRWMRSGHGEYPVEGPPEAAPLVRIGA